MKQRVGGIRQRDEHGHDQQRAGQPRQRRYPAPYPCRERDRDDQREVTADRRRIAEIQHDGDRHRAGRPAYACNGEDGDRHRNDERVLARDEQVEEQARRNQREMRDQCAEPPCRAQRDPDRGDAQRDDEHGRAGAAERLVQLADRIERRAVVGRAAADLRLDLVRVAEDEFRQQHACVRIDADVQQREARGDGIAQAAAQQRTARDQLTQHRPLPAGWRGAPSGRATTRSTRATRPPRYSRRDARWPRRSRAGHARARSSSGRTRASARPSRRRPRGLPATRRRRPTVRRTRRAARTTAAGSRG
ncbi:Uncharacterised protein [Clostridium sporogenes]|nr:Uncharacterised protein [Clostridium sporogenes]